MYGDDSYTIKSSKGQFIVRPYTKSLEKKVLASWEEAFGKKMAPELWQWKYYLNPGGYRTIVCLAEDNTVVVHYAGLGTRTWFLDQEITGLQLVDIYSHPKYRWAIGGKRGLFVTTARIFWQTFMENAPFNPEYELNVNDPKVQFVWGLPGRRHARLGQLVIKYERLPEPYYAESRKFTGKKGRFWSLETAVAGQDGLPEGIDAMWHEFRTKFRPVCVIKDKKYLLWRYWNRPESSHTYKFFWLKRPWSKKIKAWLVCQRKDNNYYRILDFLALSQEHLQIIMHRIMAETEKGLNVWLSDKSPWKLAFESSGFETMPEPLGIIPSIQGFSKGIMEKRERFHWLMGDADLF